MRASALALLLSLVLAAPLASAEPLPVQVGQVEVDLRWMTACIGSGHEERETIGPVVIRRWVCDGDV